MQLINTFPPYGDESPSGYYRRLSTANALTGWKELARLCDVTVAKSALFARPEHVSVSLGLDLAWSQQATAHDDIAREWKTLRRTGCEAICPQCLVESVHLRISWEHRYIVACPTHDIVLSDACDACGEKLNSNREQIEYCQCGHDLRLNEGRPATEAQLWLAALLVSGGTSSGGRVPVVTDVGIDLVAQLVRALCLFSDPHIFPRRQNTVPPRTVQESVEFLRPLESLLANWPSGFESHVSERIAAGPSDARTLNTLLGPWYHQLRAFAECEPLQPFLAAIGRVAAREFDGLLGLDAAAEVTTRDSAYVLVAEAAKRIGVSRDALVTQLKSGQLAHRTRIFGTRGQAFEVPVAEVKAVVAARNGWVSEKAACEDLGVPLSVLQRLVDAELLVYAADWRADLRKGGPVESRSITELISRLRHHRPVGLQQDDRKIALRALTSRRAGDKKALVAALRAIATGDIRPLSTGELVGDFQYPLTAVSKHFSTPILEAGLSIQALSRMTGWKWESISHWIEEGLLQSHSIVLRGQPCRVVLPAQLLEFCQTYVPLADLARHVGSKSSALSERMEGIEIVGSLALPGGQRRGGLIRIADLARLTLAKHRVQSKGGAPAELDETHENHNAGPARLW
jgi:hypothetical protein